MNKLCAGCGKPVFFAERKTSLGREWHPSCLKCIECGKVLSPGQHAEHKSLPYCHHPCYRALFGPSILGYGSNISSPANFVKRARPVSEFSEHGASAFSKEIYSQSSNRPKSATVAISKKIVVSQPPTALQVLLQKIETFNKYQDGKVHQQMSAEQRSDGTVEVKGPLRIYWGLSRPIQLIHCDDIEPAPMSQWRYSLFAGHKTTDIPEPKLSSSLSFRRPSSPSRHRDMDDLFSSSSTDDVVRRKKGVRKFKTVAYRGDQPTKWKRASINGHVFNYNTSVFTPVLGSCTSVTVDGDMKTFDVIETLLDKFKVQNCPDEYVLSVVREDGERLLSDTDKPLMERLSVGPDENSGKIFIKERVIPPEATIPVDSQIQMPIVETVEEENLPYEVEQLLVLPEAVLRGILAKFAKDEEKDISLVKARYETARKRILSRMGEISNQTVSVV